MKEKFVSLKARVDKIDMNKLKIDPADLSQLRNVVNNDVVKKKLRMIN